MAGQRRVAAPHQVTAIVQAYPQQHIRKKAQTRHNTQTQPPEEFVRQKRAPTRHSPLHSNNTPITWTLVQVVLTRQQEIEIVRVHIVLPPWSKKGCQLKRCVEKRKVIHHMVGKCECSKASCKLKSHGTMNDLTSGIELERCMNARIKATVAS